MDEELKVTLTAEQRELLSRGLDQMEAGLLAIDRAIEEMDLRRAEYIAARERAFAQLARHRAFLRDAGERVQ